MDIMSIKEASEKWNISERRINALCNGSRLDGAKKIAGVWLLPANAEKPCDKRIKTGKYINWRNKNNMKREDFESNIKNIEGTFAVENMKVSKSGINNLKRIEKGEASYSEIIEELKKKYTQRI